MLHSKQMCCWLLNIPSHQKLHKRKSFSHLPLVHKLVKMRWRYGFTDFFIIESMCELHTRKLPLPIRITCFIDPLESLILRIMLASRIFGLNTRKLSFVSCIPVHVSTAWHGKALALNCNAMTNQYMLLTKNVIWLSYINKPGLLFCLPLLEISAKMLKVCEN